MKIRESLVSNSSSTSFMVFHNKVDVHYLLENHTIKNFPEDMYYLYGSYFGEGIDFFPITTEMFKLMKKNVERFEQKDIYDVYAMKSSGEFSRQDLVGIANRIPEKFNIEIIDVDYHTTHDIKDFKERYLKNE